MKHQISITIDEEFLLQIRELIRKQRIFRNRSHIVECALFEFMKKKIQ
ncbi:ribbon-helix-helix protein, CopG family [Candidatus Woesearchaeota archaeon]|nr:ribbon-helix-helix protein, CopG family [Candidatus Woesearchaeota archaeon]